MNSDDATFIYSPGGTLARSTWQPKLLLLGGNDGRDSVELQNLFDLDSGVDRRRAWFDPEDSFVGLDAVAKRRSVNLDLAGQRHLIQRVLRLP